MVLLKKFKRGGGEFIGFAVSMIGLVSLILLLIGFFMLGRTSSQMENAMDIISRDIVVCESIEDARDLAQEEAEEYLSSFMSVIQADSIKTEVDYYAGSKKKWEKGNFITVFLTAYVDCDVPGISGEKTVTALVMIERSESS